MSNRVVSTALLALLLAACGDDAPAAVGTGVVDTFDGATAVETAYPGDATLDLTEFGVGHLIAVSLAPLTIYLAEYPTRFTLFDGEITLRFRQGAVAPTAVTVTFWKSTDFSRYAQASVSLVYGNAYIGWYDEKADYQEVEFQLPADLYDPAGLNTLVVRLHQGTAVMELNDVVLGEAAVTLADHDGELAWGMLPSGPGSELIVDEFSAVPAPAAAG
jgi:hypothetical protein